MNVTEAIKTRRSIREFKQDPVPREVIQEVLELTRLAPSSSNTQPWHLALVSGEARQALEKKAVSEIRKGLQAHREIPHKGPNIEQQYKDRMFDCGMRYYAAAGVERHEKDKRAELALRNWRFFDAPHVGFLSFPRCFGHANIVDIGIFLQTLMLLLTERGIASCPQGDLASYPEIVREFADVPEGNAIICGLSFGYEIPNSKINNLNMPRAELDDIVSWTE